MVFKILKTRLSHSDGIQFILHSSISTYIIMLSKHLYDVECGIATCGCYSTYCGVCPDMSHFVM